MKKIFTVLFFVLPAMNVSAQLCTPFDLSFGNNGKAIGFTTGPNSGVNSENIITQPDGKIIQAGAVYNNNTSDFIVVRYNANGSVDATFANNGRAFISLLQYSYVSDMVLQPDGKIVVAGTTYSQGNGDFVLARLKTNGTLDSSFGINGKIITAIGAGWDDAQSVSIQPDGKIVVAGVSALSANLCQVPAYYFPQAAVVRFKTNGSVDSLFGQNGKIVFGTGSYQDYAHAVAVQADGKILVAGSSYFDCSCVPGYYGGLEWYCQRPFFLMNRFNSDGTPDIGFGKNGKVADTSFLLYPSKIVLQANGKIVVTGTGTQRGYMVERFNSDGSLDNNFGQGGKVRTEIGTVNDYLNLNAAAILPNGKIVLGGGLSFNSGANFVVVRYNGDGKLDSLFKGNGIAIFHVGSSGSYETVTGLTFQDTTIIAGGHIYFRQVTDLAIVRLNEFTVRPLGSVIAANGPLSFCEGGSVILSTNMPGAKQWYYNNAIISGATSNAYPANASGVYSVEIDNAGQCGKSDDVVVDEQDNPKPQINWNGSLNFCEGDSVTLTANSLTGLQWYKDGNVISGATGLNYAAKASGSYTVRATTTLGCSGTSIPVVVKVNSLVKPVIGWSGSLSKCEGESVLLSSDNTGTNQWFKNGNPIAGATASTYLASGTGVYTHSNGCAVSEPVTVTINNIPPMPGITRNSTPHFFRTAPGYKNYQWYLNNTAVFGATSFNYAPAFLQDGLYSVEITDSNNCKNISNQFNLIVSSAATVVFDGIKLHYYPNPASNVVNVDMPRMPDKKVTASLFDISGRVMLTQTINQGHNEIAVSRLASGVYQLAVNNGKEKAVLKVVVVR